MAARGVQALTLNIYLYGDHSRVAITRRDFAPSDAPDRHIGALRLGVGRADVAGMAPALAVRTLLAAALLALPTDTSARSAPAPRTGPRGEFEDVPLPGLEP